MSPPPSTLPLPSNLRAASDRTRELSWTLFANKRTTSATTSVNTVDCPEVFTRLRAWRICTAYLPISASLLGRWYHQLLESDGRVQVSRFGEWGCL
eukprot:2678677-Pyramimonas_sp.AAC.2